MGHRGRHGRICVTCTTLREFSEIFNSQIFEQLRRIFSRVYSVGCGVLKSTPVAVVVKATCLLENYLLESNTRKSIRRLDQSIQMPVSLPLLPDPN